MDKGMRIIIYIEAGLQFISSEMPDEINAKELEESKLRALKEWDEEIGIDPHDKGLISFIESPELFFFSIDSSVDCDSWDVETPFHDILPHLSLI